MSLLSSIISFILGIVSLKYGKIMVLIRIILCGFITFILLHLYNSNYVLFTIYDYNDYNITKYLQEPFNWECILMTIFIYLLLYEVSPKILVIGIENSIWKKKLDIGFNNLSNDEKEKLYQYSEQSLIKLSKTIYKYFSVTNKLDNDTEIYSYNRAVLLLSNLIITIFNVILLIAFILKLYIIAIILTLICIFLSIRYIKAILGTYYITELSNKIFIEENNKLYK